jgi:adenylyltransferase/sulfurtransferase
MNILTKSRYDRQERITWWDQASLSKSSVLVVGAGALGNEIVKNLTLVGVGKITVVDMDIIEHTNLSRCIFFKNGDEGKHKAEVLAHRAAELNPDVDFNFQTTPVQSLGDAYVAEFDLVIAGLDNREARVWLSAALRRLNKVLIDGAIEGLMGKVQIFTPDGPCYACGMNENDWELISKRKSCTLLGKEEILGGHTPTNATTSSIIAGVEVQEAIKYLVGREDLVALKDKIWRFTGDQMTSFTSIVDVDEFCPYHELQTEITVNKVLPELVIDFWKLLSLDDDAVLSFPDEVIRIEACNTCQSPVKFGFSDLMAGQGSCAECKIELDVNLSKKITTNDFHPDLIVNKAFWPKKFIIDISTKSEGFRVSFEEENK